MSIGTDLRHAREQRGWSLDELAARTKIATSMLAAIEVDSFDRLPDGFYRRAFLRTYAREVGLDPDRVVDSYVTQFPPRTEPPPEPEAPRHSPVLSSRRALEWLNPQLQWFLLVVFGTAAVIGLIYVAPRQHSPVGTRPETSQAAQETQPGSEQPAVGTGGAAASASVAAKGDETARHAPLEVEVEPRGPCWLGATADGQRVVYRLLDKGDHVTLQAREELVLRIGDAGNFQFTVNGVEGRRLGDAGEDLTVHLTPSNFRNFVRAS